MTDVEAKFEAAALKVGGAYFRVSAEHPVDLFVGVEGGRRSLLLIATSEPPDCPVLQAMTLEKRLREDGQWAVLLQLVQRDLKGLFTSLVEDLVSVLAGVSESAQAPTVFVDRLTFWQRLFLRGKSGVLDEQALRGLVGELLFLCECASPAYGIKAAIAAWNGPFKAARDFRFADRIVEVKSIRPGASEISIASLDQLASSELPLILAVVEVDRLDKANVTMGFSVSELVGRVRGLCGTAGSDVSGALEERLSAYGYEDRVEYESARLDAKDFHYFSCGEGFPRVERSTVPRGVVDCNYSINVAAIEPFKSDNWLALK